jgi:UDP-N-acetylglucosamine 1-carboxyvinyltransferase
MSEFNQAFSQLGIDPAEIRRSDWIGRIGDLLRQARVHRQLTQGDVASAADLNQSYLSRLENAALATKGPTVDTLLRIADAIDCDVVIALSDRQSHRPIGIVRSARLESPESGNASPTQSRKEAGVRILQEKIARSEEAIKVLEEALGESLQAQYDGEEV